MKKILETKRLYLRELVESDKEMLAKVLTDPEAMQFYPEPFSLKKVEEWIQWNIQNYKDYGHGLWAVVLKSDNRFVGDCGITMQDIEGQSLPEIGYHILPEFCGQGFATEAAKGCVDYGLNQLNLKQIYTYTKDDNLPSIRVAEKVGMKFVKRFEKTIMGSPVSEVLYTISRDIDVSQSDG